MLGYFYVLMTLVSEVVATAAQKEALDFTRILPTIIMIVGYVLPFVFLAPSFTDLAYDGMSLDDVDHSLHMQPPVASQPSIGGDGSCSSGTGAGGSNIKFSDPSLGLPLF